MSLSSCCRVNSSKRSSTSISLKGLRVRRIRFCFLDRLGDHLAGLRIVAELVQESTEIGRDGWVKAHAASDLNKTARTAQSLASSNLRSAVVLSAFAGSDAARSRARSPNGLLTACR